VRKGVVLLENDAQFAAQRIDVCLRVMDANSIDDDFAALYRLSPIDAL
jgi:hypothetical protein